MFADRCLHFILSSLPRLRREGLASIKYHNSKLRRKIVRSFNKAVPSVTIGGTTQNE